MTVLKDRPVQLQERIFKKIFEVAEIAKFSKTEQKEYEASLKNYRDLKNVVDTAHQEGFDEGHEERREQGREEGMNQRNYQIARQMKRDGEPTDKIQRYTGLSTDEIEAIEL